MSVAGQSSVVTRKKEDRPEAAEHSRSKTRNQRRIDFLRSTAASGILNIICAPRWLTLDEKGELLTEKEILGVEGTLRTDKIPSEREDVDESGHNIREQTQERTFPRSQ